ncbi:hypothetical protein GCM10022254_22570 [Actinomadura meridiana]|uniref:dihydrofolate reductase n=1 Tax=Actinomadura meridiana TaxID=559626 RepID=A0ABP8BXH2_9ACTN
MNVPVTLLLLQHLIPEWRITRDLHGTWRATGSAPISAPNVNALLTAIHATDPNAITDATRLLTERGSAVASEGKPVTRDSSVEWPTMTRPRISAIAALDENNIIGAEGRLPWRIPEDTRRFRRLTMGHPVIMGRKTYESIGQKLDGRTTIIVTRNDDYTAPECVIVHSLTEALEYASAHDDHEVFIAGGEAIYQEGLDHCDRLYLTLVKGEFTGTVRFPDYSRFNKTVERTSRRDDNHEYEFVVLER